MQQQGRNEQRSSHFILGSRSRGIYKHSVENIQRPLLAAYKNATSKSYVRLLFLAVCLFIGMFFTSLLDITISLVNRIPDTSLVTPTTVHEKLELPLNCSLGNLTQTCPDDYYPKRFKLIEQISVRSDTCPEYFRWIYEDLRPWTETGITEEMVERAKVNATFRLVILDGRAYVEKYEKSYQTRDDFTIWGILQLLRKYPGKVPDLDLMFECYDYSLILKKDYQQPNSLAPPPLFRYCGDDDSYDIVFPDWSFWGWAEINIKPWDLLLEDLDEGNKRIKWIDREPYAYWKGNRWIAKHRRHLFKCNVSDTQDWNARLYSQDWGQEIRQGFKQSHLSDQCTHRFKIYIEGIGWSVSEKYILACDSVTLIITPHFHDFFTRGLIPGQHYWPVNIEDMCRSIKFAVEWGNKHEQKAQKIGKEASRFIQEELKMDNVYNYMFHLLTEYSKLMKYKPTIPENAVELCSETMGCTTEGRAKEFMDQSTVKGPSDVGPCIMQQPYDPQTLNSILERKMNSIKQVEEWEKDYYEQINQ